MSKKPKYTESEMFRFISTNRIDVVNDEGDPNVGLPRSVQLQVATNETDPGTARPTYAMLAIAETLAEAVESAIDAHGKEEVVE